MPLFGWFDASAAEAFAREIAQEFARNFPLQAPPTGAGAEQKLLHAIEILGNRAAKFNRSEPMGWYRKARFLRSIKEQLSESGGSKVLVDRVVYAVVVRMARRDESRAAVRS